MDPSAPLPLTEQEPAVNLADASRDEIELLRASEGGSQ
jgi:hypothetical protein